MKKSFEVTSRGYLKNQGVEVMAFEDDYAGGHQSAVSIIMHGNRVASNGDFRVENKQGRGLGTKILEKGNDPAQNMIYGKAVFPTPGPHAPEELGPMKITYQTRVVGEGENFRIILDLDKPLPEEIVGFARFNLELYPGALLGKPWIMDDKQGIFPQQANGPVVEADEMKVNFALHADRHLNAPMYNPLYKPNGVVAPLAVGHCLTVHPDSADRCLTIESPDVEMELFDGRFERVSGWFIVTSLIPAGKTKNALEWVVKPRIIEDWLYQPVIQISQVGYHTAQPKKAVVELDEYDTVTGDAILYKITKAGRQQVKELKGEKWGQFLRYQYLQFDFTDITEEGLYQISFRNSETPIFRIAKDIYDRGVWQPVLEYFLPVQMCHMRVNDKLRMWHNLCHMDDATMAPTDRVHFDGYVQGPSTMTKYKPGDVVPGLNVGGWHDAGDDDLRVESQAGECYIMSAAYEEFNVDYDVTTIDQVKKITEIHQPDGKNDLQQQIEHGLLSVVGAYRALGRLYRGIIANDQRQYGLLGDFAGMTENIIGDSDDRWVFTEDNPYRELSTAAHLAASARAMRGFNDALAEDTLNVAEELFEITDEFQEPEPAVARYGDVRSAKIHAACELYLATKNDKYKEYVLARADYIKENIQNTGWAVSRVVREFGDEKFLAAFREMLLGYKDELLAAYASTPFGVPYQPAIWGDGWVIQRKSFCYYFIQKAFPDIFPEDPIYDTVNYVLGCHPGSNTRSFASGVGANSTTIAYGYNRADWSFIPGGVISGTALIRPDYPELLEYPFLWQQTEYVLGGGSMHYMFLVLAAKALLDKKA